MTIDDCVIMDIDGVLADNADELNYYFRQTPMDFEGFRENIESFRINNVYKELLKKYEGVTRILLTSREASFLVFSRTTNWLLGHDVPCEYLVMRDDISEPSASYKMRVLTTQILPKWNVLWAMDDHPDVIRGYYHLGVNGLYVPSQTYGDRDKIDENKWSDIE